MQLTQIGLEILPYVDTILQATEQIMNHNKNINNMSGTLKLAMPDSILIYKMQQPIQRFVQQAPHIQLVVNSLPSDDIDNVVLNGIADIGVNCDKGVYLQSLHYQYGAPFHACLIASPFRDKNEFDFITPYQRKNISIICNEPTSSYQKKLDNYLSEKNILLNPHMKMQSIEAVKRSAINQLGIAYLPLFSVKEEIENGALCQVKTEIDDHIFTSVVVYHKNKWVSPQMQLFLYILKECIIQ